MIKKHLFITGLILSLVLSQQTPTVFVKASQTAAANFKVTKNSQSSSKYGYIKPTISSYVKNPKTKLKKANPLPSSYGSMSKTVRNQNPFGTCWAFAGIGSFEYSVDKKEHSDIDYSEEHMIQRLSKYGDTGYQITSKDNGGNEYMYSGYFASGFGPVSEEFFPYDTKSSKLQLMDDILNTKGSYRATDIQFFKTTDDENGALNAETKDAIKQAVYENGSVTCAVTWNNKMIQSDGISYYNDENGARDETNHEFLIIGWDDDYSADHFDGVTKNGAWLVRNSWGNTIGDHGYFWVSYQDKSIIPSCTIKDYEEVNSNDTIYNLDEAGALYPQVTYGGYATVGFINAFSLNKEESLKEVTFYEAETDAKYQIFYIPVTQDGTLKMEEKKPLTSKKILNYSGYHTEKITETINVKRAAIMVMIESNKEDAGFGAEGELYDGRKALYIPTLEKGQSYIYVDGELSDLYDMGGDFGNWSIKLVTQPVKTINTTPEEATTQTPSESTTALPKPETIESPAPSQNDQHAAQTTASTSNNNKTYPSSNAVKLKKAVIKKLKAGKKSVTVYIKRNDSNITGYQIRYSYKKNLTSSKYQTSQKTTYKLKGLKRKKYIYVKIRAYKQTQKGKVYGSWSNTKKIKIK